MRTAELDRWLPDPVIRTRHACRASADAATLWEAATSLRVGETGSLGRIVRWRLPGTDPGLTYRELFARPPFTVLAAGDGWSVSGMVGRIWTLARDYPSLTDGDDFRAWDEPGTARVLFAHWVEPDGAGGAVSTLVSEARVAPVDPRAATRLRALWTVVGAFERLIGGEALARAARRAESGDRGGRDLR